MIINECRGVDYLIYVRSAVIFSSSSLIIRRGKEKERESRYKIL